jgi:hypothetical protein
VLGLTDQQIGWIVGFLEGEGTFQLSTPGGPDATPTRASERFRFSGGRSTDCTNFSAEESICGRRGLSGISRAGSGIATAAT